MKMISEPFGTTKDGAAVIRYTMENAQGMTVSVLNLGGIVQRILVPDQTGRPVDVALGYDDYAGYEAGSSFCGAMVGRYANRIKGAAFTLNGTRYELEKNDGENHLHGTFSRTLFDVTEQADGLTLSHTFPDGEEGYPGTLTVRTVYRLTDDNALELEYFAESDADTVINLTNHTYFNLNGSGDVLGHTLQLMADRFTEGGEGTVPTGRILPVAGTPMDFRAEKKIGADLHSAYQQLAMCSGYDHNYVLWEQAKDGTWIPAQEPRLFARARGDVTGICLEAFTDQPGVQFYTGNFLDLDAAPYGKGGVKFVRHAGFALEAQAFPNAPNEPSFPSAVLRAGERRKQKTVYRFDPADGPVVR